MGQARFWLILVSYVAGLLATGLPGDRLPLRLYGVGLSGFLLLGLGAIASLVMPRWWKRGPRPWGWWVAGGVACLATVYLQVRSPVPSANDISQVIPDLGRGNQPVIVTVRGQIDSPPRLTRSDRIQFWLKVQQLVEITGQIQPSADPSLDANAPQVPFSPETIEVVTGRLYVTVPLLQGTGLYPRQIVEVTGMLYRPEPESYRGGFDFSEYLARQGGFAGLAAYQVSGLAQSPGPDWGWQLRQRIIRTQTQALGSPGGPLLSAMALGNRGVDLPYDVRDAFAQAGLAHTTAVSGFHVSLLLGCVLALVRQRSPRLQFALGSGVLLLLVLVTGFQPSVLRAVVMGAAALIALVMQRKVKPLGSLGVAVVLLLLINPLWIWDLGLQLSVVATLGLLTSSGPLLQRLNRLPAPLAIAIAIPVATTAWVLPLQLFHFGTVTPYSLLGNILSTPFITPITFGSFISAAIALVFPDGAVTLTHYGLQGLMQAWLALVDWLNHLPGAAYAVGQISLAQMALLYGLLVLGLWPRTQASAKASAKANAKASAKARSRSSLRSASRAAFPWPRWLIAIAMVGVVLLPHWHSQSNRVQLTLLKSKDWPIIVIQDQQQTGLVNWGDEQTVQSSLLPFLKNQGINRIAWAIATHIDPPQTRGWFRLKRILAVDTLYTPPPQPASPPILTPRSPTQSPAPIPSPPPPNPSPAVNLTIPAAQPIPPQQPLSFNNAQIQVHPQNSQVWLYQNRNTHWLWLLGVNSQDQRQLAKTGKLQPVNILWWTGEPLEPDLLSVSQPQVAIASSTSVDPDTLALLKARHISVYWTGRDGSLSWTPTDGILPATNAIEVDPKLF